MKTSNKIALIILIGILVRAILVIHFQTYEHPVAWEYERIALNITEGRGFIYPYMGGVEYRSFCAPMYPYICALLYLVFGHNFLPVLIVQALFSAFVALLIYKIGNELFSERTGLLAALLVTLHPGLIYYDVFNLIPMSLDVFFITLLIYMLVRAKREISPLHALAIGAVIGLGSLTRNVIGALSLFTCIYMAVIFRRGNFKRLVTLVMCVFAGLFLVIAPWLVRNYIIHKRIVFASTSGENLWRGNNAFATGTLMTKNGTPIIGLWPKEFQEKIYALDEMGQKEFFEREALAFIREHPISAARLYLKKLYYFWWFSPQSGFLYRKSFVYMYKLYYVILLAAFIPGLVISLRKGRHNYPGILAIVIICTGLALTQSIFYSEGRHRWLIEPFCILIAVEGIMQIVSRSKVKLNYQTDNNQGGS